MTIIWSTLVLILTLLGFIAYDYEQLKQPQNQSTIQPINNARNPLNTYPTVND